MANWKVEFIQELSKISTKLKMKDYHAFIFWYIKATEDKPDSDINELITDRIQRELETLGYYFERKEGQYNEEKAKSKRIGRLECIKNIDVIKTNIAVEMPPHIAFSKEDDLFSQYFGEVFQENKSCMDYLIPFLLWGWIAWTGRNYNRSKVRKSFYRISPLYILRLRILKSIKSPLRKNIQRMF